MTRLNQSIEDWHKVLKTGCEIEERQLQTWEWMEGLLSVYSVIAWKVLELRELARGEDLVAPEILLSEAERAVLETKFPELSGQNGKAYAIHVAKLGGYLDRGSDPPLGWQTMWKGLQKLRMWAEAMNSVLNERQGGSFSGIHHELRQISCFTDRLLLVNRESSESARIVSVF